MTRIFEPRTAEEQNLVDTIKFDSSLQKRKTALKQLRKLVGDTSTIPAINSKEVYSQIKGKPVYMKRFFSATIYFEDTLIKR